MRSILGGPRILDRGFDLAGTLEQTETNALSAAQRRFFSGKSAVVEMAAPNAPGRAD
jgi:hypothetical protein